MTVDGCTSTNDTVLVLASGRAGAVDEVALAGRGDRGVRVAGRPDGGRRRGRHQGGPHQGDRARGSDAEAHRAARRVADSLLVKCSLNGEDPYWGRVVSELGAAGVAFDLDRVSVAYGGVVVCAGGVAARPRRGGGGRPHGRARTSRSTATWAWGTARRSVLTTDLGYGYIDENRTTS